MRLMKIIPLLVLLSVMGVVVGAGTAGASPPTSFTCTGGNIPSGTYSSVLVKGVCYVPSGPVAVTGNLTVAPGALLDATTPPHGPGTAGLPGIVTVGGDVYVEQGAVLWLGCDAHVSGGPPNFTQACPSGGTTFGDDFVGGNIIGSGALAMVVHGVTVRGNVLSIGGGSPTELAGGPGSGGCFGIMQPALWNADPIGAFIGNPLYTDVEDSSIGGNLELKNIQTCWLGAVRVTVGGNVIDQNNLMGDPDANEVVGNTVSGNIICFNNDSFVQFGDSGAGPNVVSGNALGECGFNVHQPDPLFDGGGPQPISIKA